MKNKRLKILQSLLDYQEPLKFIKKKLILLEWDSEEEFVFLSTQNIKQILLRYINNEISESEVEEWANLIEVREDIGRESSNSELLDEIVFNLANPHLTSPLTKERVNYWLNQI